MDRAKYKCKQPQRQILIPSLKQLAEKLWQNTRLMLIAPHRVGWQFDCMAHVSGSDAGKTKSDHKWSVIHLETCIQKGVNVMHLGCSFSNQFTHNAFLNQV